MRWFMDNKRFHLMESREEIKTLWHRATAKLPSRCPGRNILLRWNDDYSHQLWLTKVVMYYCTKVYRGKIPRNKIIIKTLFFTSHRQRDSNTIGNHLPQCPCRPSHPWMPLRHSNRLHTAIGKRHPLRSGSLPPKPCKQTHIYHSGTRTINITCQS